MHTYNVNAAVTDCWRALVNSLTCMALQWATIAQYCQVGSSQSTRADGTTSLLVTGAIDAAYSLPAGTMRGTVSTRSARSARCLPSASSSFRL